MWDQGLITASRMAILKFIESTVSSITSHTTCIAKWPLPCIFNNFENRSRLLRKDKSENRSQISWEYFDIVWKSSPSYKDFIDIVWRPFTFDWEKLDCKIDSKSVEKILLLETENGLTEFVEKIMQPDSLEI